MSQVETTRPWAADLDLLESMFSESFDWTAHYEGVEGDTPEEVFQRAYKWHDYRKGDRPVGTGQCGGAKFEDTPQALYRALYLLQPEEVDFSDMYKTGTLVDFCSPNYEFVCSLQLFKYEVGIYFECARQHVQGQLNGVRGGWPSCDNGVQCRDSLGQKWFQLAVVALERQWDVYSGNRFQV